MTEQHTIGGANSLCNGDHAVANEALPLAEGAMTSLRPVDCVYRGDTPIVTIKDREHGGNNGLEDTNGRAATIGTTPSDEDMT